MDTKGSIGNITLSVLKKSSHKLPAAFHLHIAFTSTVWTIHIYLSVSVRLFPSEGKNNKFLAGLKYVLVDFANFLFHLGIFLVLVTLKNLMSLQSNTTVGG